MSVADAEEYSCNPVRKVWQAHDPQLSRISCYPHLEHSSLACSQVAQASNSRHVVQASDTLLHDGQVGSHLSV